MIVTGTVITGDPARPVVVEAESSKVGDCRIPPRLWRAMVEAPRIAIDAPRDVTIRRLIVNDERRPSLRQAPYIPPQTD